MQVKLTCDGTPHRWQTTESTGKLVVATEWITREPRMEVELWRTPPSTMPALNFYRFPIDLPQLSTGDNAHFPDHAGQQTAGSSRRSSPFPGADLGARFRTHIYQFSVSPSQLHSMLHQFLFDGVLEMLGLHQIVTKGVSTNIPTSNFSCPLYKTGASRQAHRQAHQLQLRALSLTKKKV